MQGQSVQEQHEVDYDEEIETIREAHSVTEKELAEERRAIQEETAAKEVGDFLGGLFETEYPFLWVGKTNQQVICPRARKST